VCGNALLGRVSQDLLTEYADKKLLLTKPAQEKQDCWQKKNLEIFA
jgi:hypothetical protein